MNLLPLLFLFWSAILGFLLFWIVYPLWVWGLSRRGSASSSSLRKVQFLFAGMLVFLGVHAGVRVVFPDAHLWFVWINSFTLYVYLPAYPLCLLSLLLRQKLLALGASFLIVFHLWMIFPLFQGATSPPPFPQSTPVLRLFCGNLLVSNASPSVFFEEILASEADILALQEYSSLWEPLFQDKKIQERYPYQLKNTRGDCFGMALFSKWPIEKQEFYDFEGVPLLRIQVRFHSVSFVLYNIHTLPPRSLGYMEVWHQQQKLLLEKIEEEKELSLILCGDFNATPYSAFYDKLLAQSLQCAFQNRGMAGSTTFPNQQLPLPPLRIDHAFFRGRLQCTALKVGQGAGSDHRPFTVDFVWDSSP
jgi:endonuclease/exonuclease/phosphatase (EEP) superfamily protein YafD